MPKYIETLADSLEPLRRRFGRNQSTEFARQNFRLSYRESCRTMLAGKSKTNANLPALPHEPNQHPARRSAHATSGH
jgi:hypothetical protein